MLYKRLVALNPGFHSKTSRLVMDATKRFHKGIDGSYLNFGEQLSINFEDAMDKAADWIAGIFGEQPQDEPVSEKIIDHVEATLTELVRGSDYYTTPERIERGLDSIMSHKGQNPVISIVSQSSEWMPRGEESNNAVSARMRIEIVFLQRSRDNYRGEQAVHRTVRDIATALLQDPQRSGLATSTTIVGVEYLHSDRTASGLEGASMEVEFEYRTPFSDLNRAI
jgi:hypothetical protein